MAYSIKKAVKNLERQGGNTFLISFTMPAEIDITGANVKLHVFNKVCPSASSYGVGSRNVGVDTPILKKESPNANITIDTPPQKVTIKFLPEDTLTIMGQTYYYEIELILSNGEQYTVLCGDLKLTKERIK